MLEEKWSYLNLLHWSVISMRAYESLYLIVVNFRGTWQTTSKRLSERKVAKFQKNITKRGSIPETSSKKGYDYPVGPILLGFFVFVVIGSCMHSAYVSSYFEIFSSLTCIFMDVINQFLLLLHYECFSVPLWHGAASKACTLFLFYYRNFIVFAHSLCL